MKLIDKLYPNTTLKPSVNHPNALWTREDQLKGPHKAKHNVFTQGNKDVHAQTHKKVSVLYYGSVCNNLDWRADDALNFTNVAPHLRQNCLNTEVAASLLHSIAYYTQTQSEVVVEGLACGTECPDKPLLGSVPQQQTLFSPPWAPSGFTQPPLQTDRTEHTNLHKQPHYRS